MSYLSQSAVEYDGLSATAKRKLCPPELIALTYMAQKKYDGVSAIIFTGCGFGINHGAKVLSRTGEDYTVSCGHLLKAAQELFGENMVLFGEVWHPDMEFEDISGHFRRHAPAPDLQFAAFDAVQQDEYDAGYSGLEYRHRFQGMFDVLVAGADLVKRNSPIFLAATYNPGTYGTTEKFITAVMSTPGFDGIIQRLPNAPWLPGKDKHGYVIKTKPTITVDLKVLGIVDGKGRNVGKVGALTCQLGGGRTVNVNIPEDKDRIAFLTDTPDIIEVEAMKFGKHGSLREPRFKRVRFDTTPDF